MKRTIRTFSIGLIAAGIILLITYYFFDDSITSGADMDVDEMITKLEKAGYRIVSEADYIKLSINDDQTAEESTEQEESKEVEDESPEDENIDKEELEEETPEIDEPTSVTISVISGMASSEISALLVEQNLIQDAQSFNNYLEEHNYAPYIQLGDHELRTDMSFYEIAEALTN